jgi:diguanylate cyclase (GGDEF)-like protein
MTEANENHYQPFDEIASTQYEEAYQHEKEAQDREEKIKALEKKVQTDSLTGLPNEEFYKDFVQKYDKRKPYGLTVSYLDITNFKQINDRFGHDVGDQKIKEFADYMNTSKREFDVLMHFHGDEFVLLSIPTEENKETEDGLKISPQEGLAKHMNRIWENSAIKFDYASVQFNPQKHTSLNDATIEADKIMLINKENRKAQANLPSNISTSE